MEMNKYCKDVRFEERIETHPLSLPLLVPISAL